MSTEDYLGEDAVRVALSPARVVYLVPAGDKKAFRQAVRDASSRWAGVTCPIVPVRRDGRQDSGWTQMARTARCAAAVGVGLQDDVAQQAADRLQLPFVPLSRIDRTWSMRALHWSAVVSADTEPTACRPDSPLWEAVAAGDPEEPDDGPSLLPVHRGGTDDVAGRAAMAGNTVLDAGLAGFGEHLALNLWSQPPTVLWVTARDSLRDATWFWNLRALRPTHLGTAPMILIPEKALTDWVGITDRLEDVLRRPYAGNPDVVLRSLSLNEERLAATAERLGLIRTTDPIRFTEGWPPARRTGPFTYTSGVDPRGWLLFDREYGYSGIARVQRFRHATVVPVAAAGLADTVKPPVFGPMAVTVSGGFLDHLPRVPSVARLVQASASWTHGELTVGIDYHERAELTLASPTPHAVLDAMATNLNAGATLSGPGRVGDALLVSKDCTVLLAPYVLRIVRELTTPRSKELARELRSQAPGTPQATMLAIAQAWGGRTERRHRTLTQLGGAAVLKAAEGLARDGWVERGLTVHCETCGSRTFVALTGTTPNARCPGCGSPAAFVAGPAGLDVSYRLDALVDRASDQGVVPHLAALMALRTYNASAHVRLGTDLAWPDGSKAEVDLYGFLGRSVIAGEVKTSASEFTEQQIARDVRLTEQLLADTHVMACTASLPTLIVRRASGLCDKAGLALLVVDLNDEGVITTRTV